MSTLRPLILLVDDERTVLDSLRNQLRAMFANRFTYETAEGVAEAWEVLTEVEHDAVVLIVSDWLMPEMRGDQFLVDVAKRFPRTARVMITGQADEDAIARAYAEAQVLRVIAKPWEQDQLRATVEEAAERAATPLRGPARGAVPGHR